MPHKAINALETDSPFRGFTANCAFMHTEIMVNYTGAVQSSTIL